MACITSAAFKGGGESIVAAADRRHISRPTALNAYIKSESFTGTKDICHPGVRSACGPSPALRGEARGEGALAPLFYAALLYADELL